MGNSGAIPALPDRDAVRGPSTRRYSADTLGRRNMGGSTVAHSIETGDAAPAFRMQTSDGRRASLKEFAGSPLVLFFYPQDDTETCTKEAVGFSGMQSRYSRKKIGLLGISPDPVETHLKFIAKYDLKVRLGADPDLAVTKAYQCWGQKKLYGREYMGVIRSTFVIDGKGVIQALWRNVRVKGHAEAAFEAASALV